MPELDAEHRDQMAAHVEQIIADHHMWIGDNGKPLDYLPEREARIGECVAEIEQALAPLVAGWIADAWDNGWDQAEESWGHEEPAAVNPYRGGDDG